MSRPSHSSTGTLPRFIDYKAILDHDEVTSPAKTTHSGEFQENVIERDQDCVVTAHRGEWCDAVHIIPRCKGDAVRLPPPHGILS